MEAEAEWNAPLDPMKRQYNIGMRMFKARIHLGYSLVQLMYRSELSFQMLEDIEWLNIAVDYDTVARIAEAMNLTAEELLNWGRQ